MPRQLTSKFTLAALEDEVHYTRAALQADPDASDLLADTDGWMGDIDALRAAQRSLAQERITLRARRTITNARLDGLARRFGELLYITIEKDRSAPRWKALFGSATTSEFLRQPFAEQVRAMRAWLSTDEPLLAERRADFEAWLDRADALIADEARARINTADGQTRRANAGRQLTQARDTLHRRLAERATERDLNRTWPDGFFLIG